jgi:hypothetical protein
MRYVITGRVLPERAAAFFSQVRWETGAGSYVTASCDASELCVVIDNPHVADPATAKILAEDYAHIVVASLGFALGSRFVAEAIQVIEPTGEARVFGVRNENLVFPDTNDILNRSVVLATKNVFFRLALRDYVRAITDAADCATYCYRAIEAIKSSFQTAQADGWSAMHAALHTDRDLITATVKDFADPIRHGNWSNAPVTTGLQRSTMLNTTRDVLKKFLDYAP